MIQSLPILWEAKSFYYLDKPYYNSRDTPFNISKNYNITRVNAIVYKMQLIDQCLSSIDFDTNENKTNLFSHYFEMLWIGLFNYFFYCNKNNIKEDLSFLHSGFIKYKHLLKHIKLSLLKKIGILLFFWKQWHQILTNWSALYGKN